MNFTKQQTVVTYEYYNGLNLLSKIYKEKVIQSIKEIVRENGGIIDLVEDNDGYKDYNTSAINIIMFNRRRSNVNLYSVFNFDLEGFSYVGEDYEGDGIEEVTYMNYEDCPIDTVATILKGLYDYNEESPF